MALFAPSAAARAFWPRAYARRRLGAERLAPLAPLHYALVGEARGFRPNGFFDPRFYRERAGLRSDARGLLGRYLASSPDDSPPPSPEFDPAWYAAQNPDSRATHPFLHFLEVGLPGGRRPRADIDMIFVRDVIRGRGRSLEEAAMRVFDPKPRDGDMKPPLTREDLFARQQRFYDAGRLRIDREGPAQAKTLVFVQCGRGFDAPWLARPRAFDVLLNRYEEAGDDPRADVLAVQAGTKTTAIRRLLAERPDLLLRYESVLFLDDDVELGGADIDALFRAAEAGGLDLAQPALTADSETAFAFLKRPEAPAAAFETTSVEVMAPLMTRRALAAAGWAFSQSVSGWGTDLLLGPAVRAAFGGARVGVVGSVAARHARKVDLSGGAFYAYLRRYGVDPAHEANRVAADFHVPRHPRRLAPGEAGPTCRRVEARS